MALALYLPYQTNRVAATADIDTCQLIALPVHIYHHPLLSAVGLFIIRAKFVHLNNINYLKSMTIILTKVMVGYFFFYLFICLWFYKLPLRKTYKPKYAFLNGNSKLQMKLMTTITPKLSITKFYFLC